MNSVHKKMSIYFEKSKLTLFKNRLFIFCFLFIKKCNDENKVNLVAAKRQMKQTCVNVPWTKGIEWTCNHANEIFVLN